MNRLFLIPVFALLAGVSLSVLDIQDAQAHEYYEYEEYSSYEGYGRVPPGHLPPPDTGRDILMCRPGISLRLSTETENTNTITVTTGMTADI